MYAKIVRVSMSDDSNATSAFVGWLIARLARVVMLSTHELQ